MRSWRRRKKKKEKMILEEKKKRRRRKRERSQKRIFYSISGVVGGRMKSSTKVKQVGPEPPFVDAQRRYTKLNKNPEQKIRFGSKMLVMTKHLGILRGWD